MLCLKGASRRLEGAEEAEGTGDFLPAPLPLSGALGNPSSSCPECLLAVGCWSQVGLLPHLGRPQHQLALAPSQLPGSQPMGSTFQLRDPSTSGSSPPSAQRSPLPGFPKFQHLASVPLILWAVELLPVSSVSVVSSLPVF